MTAGGGLRGMGEPISLRSGEIGGNRASLTRILPCRFNWLMLRENKPLRIPRPLSPGTCDSARRSGHGEAQMADNSRVFRQLACSDMVRKAAQADVKHQPIPNDDRIDSLLERLSQAEAGRSVPEEKDPQNGNAD